MRHLHIRVHVCASSTIAHLYSGQFRHSGLVHAKLYAYASCVPALDRNAPCSWLHRGSSVKFRCVCTPPTAKHCLVPAACALWSSRVWVCLPVHHDDVGSTISKPRSSQVQPHQVVCSGVRVLLNLLERGHTSVQPQLLSLISDMVRMNPHACDLIRSWKSQYTNRTALQVLLHIWRDAEADWGVCTNGVLNSVNKPLAGIGRRNLWIPKHEVCPLQSLYKDAAARPSTVGTDASSQ